MPTRSLDKDPLYQGLLLSLPFREGTGTLGTADVARPHHPVAMTHAPAWVQVGPNNLWVLDFDGTNDLLSCLAASCTDLDFTTGDFSGAAWQNIDTLKNNSPALYRYTASKGWLFGHHANGKVWITTYSAGGAQVTETATSTAQTGAWQLIGWSRTGTSARVYVNGNDATSFAATHDAIVSANTNLNVAYNGSAGVYLDGRLWNPRIWGRALRPSEHRQLFDRERARFNV